MGETRRRREYEDEGPNKGGGMPVWAWVVGGSALAFLLLVGLVIVAVAVIAAKGPTPAVQSEPPPPVKREQELVPNVRPTERDDRKPSASDQGKASGHAPAPADSPPSLEKAPSDFDELGRWCQRSADEEKAAFQANPIRGQELRESHLEQLRGNLLGKQVRWRSKATITSDGIIIDWTWGKPLYKVADELYPHYLLIANMRGREDPAYKQQFPPPGHSYFVMPRERLRALSNGDYVTVVGTMTKVSMEHVPLQCSIEVADATVAPEGGAPATPGKPADSPLTRPADRPAEKPTDKPAEEEKPLILADVISQEFDRGTKERAALAAAGLRSPSQIPVKEQIPDPYAGLKALLESQNKERKALQGKTVEGTAEFLEASRNAAGAWIVSLRVRLPKTVAGFSANAPGDAEANLRKVQVGQQVKVRGKITALGGVEVFSLGGCTFSDPEVDQGQVAAEAERKAAEAEKKRRAAEAKQAEKDEEAASERLKYAKKLLEQGMGELAKERLQKIVKEYPKSKAAEQARELLKKLGQD